jgi:ribose-phosphate pyrophosphokinase
VTSSENSIKLFTGTSHPELAREVGDYLDLELGDCTVSRFADGEVSVVVEESVRGKDVYIVQSLSRPVNHSCMELMVMADALRRSSAKTISAVLPYYAYGRQDRQAKPRTPITAKLLADLLTTSGVDRVMSMDLHAGQIQGFFSVPFDHLYATPILLKAMEGEADGNPENCIVVSPDTGGVERARQYGKRLGSGIAIIDKRRPRPNVAQVMNVIGDVQGKTALIVDDMIDTAGTLCSAAQALKDNGAERVCAFATHGLFNGPAAERINNSVLSRVYITNTIPVNPTSLGCSKIDVLSAGAVIGEAIRRVHGYSSVSSLWK